MPLIGLGTGGYASGRSSMAHAENWNYTLGYIASQQWIELGGKRIDAAITYPSVKGVGAGMLNITQNYTAIPRSQLFITNKMGPTLPLGYNDTISQFKQLLSYFQVDYFDLLLIHWPSDNSTISYKSTDIYCNPLNVTTYSASKCRQSTWLAMQYIFTELKGAKAIGISNFEMKHFNDILNMNQSYDKNGNINPKWIPSVNQFEFHGYWHEFDLVKSLKMYNVTVNSYSPLGTPDIMYGDWKVILTQHPTAQDIGLKYNKSASQVWIRWALDQNILVQPRTKNITHMKENLDVFDFNLTSDEFDMLCNVSDRPNDPKVCPNPQYLD